MCLTWDVIYLFGALGQIKRRQRSDIAVFNIFNNVVVDIGGTDGFLHKTIGIALAQVTAWPTNAIRPKKKFALNVTQYFLKMVLLF